MEQQMISDSTLTKDINALKDEIGSALIQTRGGKTIDISRFPDRLLALHNRVKQSNDEDRVSLTKAFEELLGILDELAKEIQQQYNEITDQINILDPEPEKNKE